MRENLTPLGIERPGFYANGTRYQSKGRWHEGNYIRFHEGTIQPIGGWIQRLLAGAVVGGVPTAAVCWQLSDGTPFLAVGTTAGLYVIDNDNVVFDITPDAADIHAAPFDWHLSTFGAYLRATNSLRGDDDISLVNDYVWTGVTTDKAVPAWTSDVGPNGVYAGFTTPERFLVALRGQDPTTHTARSGVDTPYSERRVYWASRETLSGFVSTDTNTGGDFDLQTDGRIVTGIGGRGQSLIWTDIDLWTMTYIGGELVYSFQNVGKECGIVGRRAFVWIDKGAFWMGRGKFFVYDGFVRPIPCEVTDRVFKDFNEQRAHTVWAMPNSKYNEITWFYPSAGAQYPDRYVTYNHVEEHWVFGVFDRTIGVPTRFRRDVIDEKLPYMFDQSGLMYEHESGQERGKQAWLASGPLEAGNGDRLMRLQGIMPDDLRVGDVKLRIYTSMASDALERLEGPYSLAAITPLRLTARSCRLRIEEASSSSWRVGNVRLGVIEAERRGSGPGAQDTTPASLEIIPPDVTLIQHQFYTFQAVVRNAAGEVLDIKPDSWVSSDPTLITVDDTGTIRVISAPAEVTITAHYSPLDLDSNAASVHVAARPAASLSIESTVNVQQGGTAQLHPIVRDSLGVALNGYTVTWVSDDETEATVDANGLVTGVALSGECNVTATIAGTSIESNPCIVTVAATYVIHVFDTVGTNAFVVSAGGEGAEVLMIGGGGSGGSVDGTGVGAGGGGAGGLIRLTNVAFTPQSYALSVGQGGTAPVADHNIGGGVFGAQPGADGVSTQFLGRVAGFGGGGGGNAATAMGIRNGRDGHLEGGSGGGGATSFDIDAKPTNNDGGTHGAANYTDAFGYDGGDGSNTGNGTGAGGGGAGSPGQSFGPGGAGMSLDIEDVPGGTHKEYCKGGAARSNEGGHVVESAMGHGGEGGGNQLSCQGSSGSSGRIVIRYRLASGIVATGGTRYEVGAA